MTIDPLTCPLCGEANSCAAMTDPDKIEECWCRNSNIVFPVSLLDKVPPAQKRKACICLSCVTKHQENRGVNIYTPQVEK